MINSFFKTALLILVFSLPMFGQEKKHDTDKKPNIIFILTDDQGYYFCVSDKLTFQTSPPTSPPQSTSFKVGLEVNLGIDMLTELLNAVV